jgi:hypothetical protein
MTTLCITLAGVGTLSGLNSAGLGLSSYFIKTKEATNHLEGVPIMALRREVLA